MSKIMNYRRAVIDRIKATITDARSVEPHGGAFNIDELQRLVADSPSIYVSVLRAKQGAIYSTGQISALFEMSAVIVSRHIGREDADMIAWALAEHVYQLLCWNNFGPTSGFEPRDIVLENLWSDKADAQGFSICAVAWGVEMLISDDRFADGEFAPAHAEFQFPSVLSVNSNNVAP